MGGKYTWSARDKKLGMSSDEVIAGIQTAHSMLKSMTPMAITVRIGWNGQIKEMTASAEEVTVPIINENPGNLSQTPRFA